MLPAFMILLFAAVVLSCWNRVQDVYNQRGSGGDSPIRFMTYNIRHAEGMDRQVRLSAIRDQLELGGADFIALQEVDRYQWRTGLQDQASYLAKALNMNVRFTPAFRHGLSEYGIALLSRHPLENVRTYRLPGGKDMEPRVVLTAQVRLEQQPVTLVTTHLGVPRSEREMQMPALLEILQAIGTPLIVMGDFNMPDSDVLMSGLHKMLYKVPLDAPQATVAKGSEIDHIFTSFAHESSAWLQVSDASDHLPVFCQISLFP
jgi:endonuclease/exonuclease/phosphatase family metal-dependent hydrolase